MAELMIRFYASYKCFPNNSFHRYSTFLLWKSCLFLDLHFETDKLYQHFCVENSLVESLRAYFSCLGSQKLNMVNSVKCTCLFVSNILVYIYMKLTTPVLFENAFRYVFLVLRIGNAMLSLVAFEIVIINLYFDIMQRENMCKYSISCSKGNKVYFERSIVFKLLTITLWSKICQLVWVSEIFSCHKAIHD